MGGVKATLQCGSRGKRIQPPGERGNVLRRLQADCKEKPHNVLPILHSSFASQDVLPSHFLYSFPMQILGWLTVIGILESALQDMTNCLREDKIETRERSQLYENVEILPPVSKLS